MIPCLTWTFFFLFPLGCVLSSILIWMFRRRIVISILFFLSGSMRSSRLLWRLVQRPACIWYVRALTSFFMCCLRRCGCASVIMCTTLCLLYCFTEVFLPLKSYWGLPCDHGLHCIAAISCCENNNSSYRCLSGGGSAGVLRDHIPTPLWHRVFQGQSSVVLARFMESPSTAILNWRLNLSRTICEAASYLPHIYNISRSLWCVTYVHANQVWATY